MPSAPAFPRISTHDQSHSESVHPSSDNISDDDSRNQDDSERVTWRTSDTPRQRKTTAPASTRQNANKSSIGRQGANPRSEKFAAFRPQGQLQATHYRHASDKCVANSSAPSSRLPLRPLSRSQLNTRSPTPAGALKAVDNARELMIHSDDIEEESDLGLDFVCKWKSDSDAESSQVQLRRESVTQQNISTRAAPKWRPDRRKMNLESEEDSDTIENISSQEDTVRGRHSKVRVVDDIESQVPSLPTAGCDAIEDTSQVLDTQLRDSPAVIRYSRAGVIDLDLIPSSASHSIVVSQAKDVTTGESEDLLPEKPFKTPKSFWPHFAPLTPSSSGNTKPLVTASQIAQRIQQQPYYYDMESTPQLSASKLGYCQTPTVSKTIQQNKCQSRYTTGIAGLVASWVVKVHSDVQLNALVGNVSPSVGLSKRRADNLDIDKTARFKPTRGLRTYEFWKVVLNNKGYSYGSKNYAGFTLVHLQRCGRQQEYSSDDDFGIDSPGDGEIAWAFLFDATNASSLVPTSTGPNDVSLMSVMLSDTRLTKGTILRLYKPVWRVEWTDQDMDAFFKAGYDSYSDKRVIVCINWQIVE
ncbi:hypothetical protein V1525DRAFT_380276 [Lipomyces kononenkoae]|uniref:Uncharacterized protein n=1 Tax=Lipomyces kononenkoae TaxID=34357 RepID=A0ACC3SWP1_LIPKO